LEEKPEGKKHLAGLGVDGEENVKMDFKCGIVGRGQDSCGST
jgi:hypothetical protein